MARATVQRWIESELLQTLTLPFRVNGDVHYVSARCGVAVSPDDRFASADELRVQMLGVLREVVAQDQQRSGRAISSASSLLFEEPAIATDTLDWQTLPALRVDPNDPQASWLHGLAGRCVSAALEHVGGTPCRHFAHDHDLAQVP